MLRSRTLFQLMPFRRPRMRLTRYTDYAMRTLLYVGARPERLCAISEVANAYGISRNHLMKVVNDLVNAGYLESVRGRFGGIRLSRPAGRINVGEVVRHTEDGFDLVDCASCIIAPACGLTGALNEALAAFMAVLDRYTLEDLMQKRSQMARLLGLGIGDPTGSLSRDEIASKPVRSEQPAAASDKPHKPD